MRPTPEHLTSWINRISSSDCTEDDAIASYPSDGIGVDLQAKHLWPLLFYRFSTDSWREQIVTKFNQEFVKQKSDNWLLEDTLVKVERFIPVLKLFSPYHKLSVSKQDPTAPLATDLDTVYQLLTTGEVQGHRDKYFKVILAKEIPGADLLGLTLELLETDEWGDLPYPISSLIEIFDAAVTDPRIACDSIAEIAIATAALETGISSKLAKELTHSDAGVVSEALGMLAKLESRVTHNRFVGLYLLGLFDPQVFSSPGSDSWRKMSDVAVLMNTKLTVDDRTLWMRATHAVGDGRSRLSCWCRLSGVSHRSGKQTSLDDLWKLIQPAWQDLFPLWEALGLSGTEWINAGAALGCRVTRDAANQLPNNVIAFY